MEPVNGKFCSYGPYELSIATYTLSAPVATHEILTLGGGRSIETSVAGHALGPLNVAETTLGPVLPAVVAGAAVAGAAVAGGVVGATVGAAVTTTVVVASAVVVDSGTEEELVEIPSLSTERDAVSLQLASTTSEETTNNEQSLRVDMSRV